MKKRIFNLIVPVQSKIKPKKSTGNLHQFINRIPCDAQKLSQPSKAWVYIDEEMKEYPIPRKTQSSTKVVKPDPQPTKKNQTKDKTWTLLKISLSMDSRLQYLQIEELKEILQIMPAIQVEKNKKHLKHLSYKLGYKIQTERNHDQYVINAGLQLIKLIDNLLQKKSSKVI